MASARTPRAPRVEIEVTDDIIESAVEKDSSHCLWAEAIRVAVPDAAHISVDLQTMRFTDPKKGLRYTYLTPRAAQVAIVNFDQGVKPEPHSVRLRGGQVTRAGRREASFSRSSKPLTDAQKKQRSEASKKRKTLDTAQLVNRHDGTGEVPDRVGGKTPPVMSIARRRSFGLRALVR